ncbi:hypothetical protein MKW92_050076 [Papaver armeniacum]|nr:hypothetical protein MKW92_050076 [Papaver armeniacum]
MFFSQLLRLLCLILFLSQVSLALDLHHLLGRPGRGRPHDVPRPGPPSPGRPSPRT